MNEPSNEPREAIEVMRFSEFLFLFQGNVSKATQEKASRQKFKFMYFCVIVRIKLNFQCL